VRDEFGDSVRVLLDGGESQIGVESTIVSCIDGVARLLRPGFITRSQLERVVGPLADDGAAPRAPGDRDSHYAPATPLEIVASDALEARASEITARHQKVAVLAMRPPLHAQRFMTWINGTKRADAYAHGLYNNLRTLDRAGCVKIFVEAPPADERWAAVCDRLRRAGGMQGAPAARDAAGT
jgi:L-threonylcarbamoyladenylate synthase